MTKNALERAIESAGNARKLAEMLHITGQSLGRWKNKYNGVVPPGRVIPIYLATGVTPHELRPDLHPTPTSGIPEQDTPAGDKGPD